MKRAIFILGILATIILSVVALFKLFHWPGAGVMIVAGIFILVLVFLPLALLDNFRNEGTRKTRWLYIVTFITCLVVFGGVLFKIMHWPGSGIVILFAIPFPFVIFLPVYLWTTGRLENYDIHKTVFVLFLVAYVSVISALLALNVSRDFLNETLSVGTTFRHWSTALSQGTETSGNSSDQVKQLEQSAGGILMTIGECREKIRVVTGTTEEEMMNKGLYGVQKKDSRIVSSKALLAGGDFSLASKLEGQIESYIREISLLPGSSGLVTLARELFSMQEKEGDGPSWGERMFADHFLSWTLTDLEETATNVRIIQNEAERMLLSTRSH